MTEENTQGTENQGGGVEGAVSSAGSTESAQGGGTILTQGSGGGDNLGWRGSLPKELQGEKSLASIKDVNALAKGYVEAQKFIGGSVRIPKVDAKPEEWEAFYDKMGRPKSPEEYQIKMPDMGELALDENLMNNFLQTAHKIGLNHKQVQALLDMQTGYTKEQHDAARVNLSSTLNTLKEEWGPSFTRRAVLAQRAVKEFGGQDVEALLDSTGLGNHPAVIKLFSRIGEVLAEDGFISGRVEGVPTPDEAKGKIGAIMSDKQHPYHDATNPMHKQAVEEMHTLYRLAYSD